MIHMGYVFINQLDTFFYYYSRLFFYDSFDLGSLPRCCGAFVRVLSKLEMTKGGEAPLLQIGPSD
jgi:hypothetical protein